MKRKNLKPLKNLRNLKNSFIGGEIKSTKLNEGKKYLFDDIIRKNTIISESEEEVDISFKEQRYRNLQRKGYVYDSLDDEENLDEEKRRFFIKPESRFIILFDFFLTLSSLYYLTYIPYFLGSREFFCQNSSYFIREYILELFVDFVFIFDFILPFFTAFYNFDEILQTRFRQRSKKYLKGIYLL